jgi:hypothetical protein
VGHLQWLITIGASSKFIVSGTWDDCDGAVRFQLYLCCLFASFLLSCIVDALCISEGLKGLAPSILSRVPPASI